MLRAGLLIFGFILTGAGLALLAVGDTPAAKPPLIFGAILVIAVLCERWRYRHGRYTPNGRWQPTGERFVDPESGQTMEVFYDPVSGERCYKAEHDHLPPPMK